MHTMQSRFFELWIGTWPTTIDWTGAVLSTYISATLRSLVNTVAAQDRNRDDSKGETRAHLDLTGTVNQYFTQITSYYFGEAAFALRGEAYDDMLWVVLGWLENLRFIDLQNRLHLKASPDTETTVRSKQPWYGKQFEPAFAHRAHVFYNLVAGGWDSRLCGGGLTWNPHKQPYKNTITNTLFVTASIDMYLYHPGDNNSSPFLASDVGDDGFAHTAGIPSLRRHDPSMLRNAIRAYDWLERVNMSNAHGLLVDGYHIRNWRDRNDSSDVRQCDVRDETLYTYNQGVLLSGLRGLWEATGDESYLAKAHRLVRNTIAATGWDLRHQRPVQGMQWAGLGRGGVMEEFCDRSGSCSQDGQTFKGIYFHHLTRLCEALATEEALIPGITFLATRDMGQDHAARCKSYLSWVGWNAKAVMGTRDSSGLFGMWWTPGLWNLRDMGSQDLPRGANDYKNTTTDAANTVQDFGEVPGEVDASEWDPNLRGRGRTVETQGGGLMVLRCLWQLRSLYK